MLPFLRRNADEVRRLIGETRELRGRPFSANFILLELDGASERIDVCLETEVGVVSPHWHEPGEYIDRVHAADASVMYTAGSAEEAWHAVDSEVDIIVAQGWESGGHVRGDVATMALLPRIVVARPVSVFRPAASSTVGAWQPHLCWGPTAFESGRGSWAVRKRPLTSHTRNVYFELRKPGLFFQGVQRRLGRHRQSSAQQHGRDVASGGAA